MTLAAQLTFFAVAMLLGGRWWGRYALGTMRLWLRENDPIESVGLSNLEVPGRYREVRSGPREDNSAATAYWLAIALQALGGALLILAWQLSRPHVGP